MLNNRLIEPRPISGNHSPGINLAQLKLNFSRCAQNEFKREHAWLATQLNVVYVRVGDAVKSVCELSAGDSVCIASEVCAGESVFVVGVWYVVL
jgi:hypothetical protein